MDAADSPGLNALLAALPAAAYRRLLPDLQPAFLDVDQTLFQPDVSLPFAYFPTTSVITVAYAVGGAMAKAWPVGREGVVGISLFLGSRKRDNRADVQVAGSAYRLSAAALIAEFERAGALQRVLLRYVFALLTQASQLGVCSNYHVIDERLCRFLVRLFDRLPTLEIAMTQQRIAALLGVRRESVTEAAGRLQAAGIIELRRGHIRLLQRRKLERQSCACAGIIRRAFAEVIA